MKILLIEDNKEISNNIKQYLELDWYIVDCFYDWESWLDNAIKTKYDLILLDLMLPKIDWITISRKLQDKIKTPIIIISAKEDIETKLKWFNYWAIDYIVKPFDLRELDIRIKIILWKKDLWKKDFSFDFESRIFSKNDIEIKLWKTEFQIIKLLYDNRTKFISRTYIIQEIWWEKHIFLNDWKLDVYISNLRNKLWKSAIETSKWFGYKFNL